MKSTAQKLILLSFVLAVAFATVVFIYLKSLKNVKVATRSTTITVIVAAKTIPPRTLIDKNMIKKIQVENSSIFRDYINNSSSIVGKYTKETVNLNEGFYASNLQDKNGNELSFKIDSDHRAISISVTGDSGVSDLIKVGDYVDVVNYVSEKKDGTTVVRPEEAKIILQKIEVLAVNQQINTDDKSGSAASTGNNSGSSGSTDKALTNYLITLSIPIADIEKLVLAESIGTIKLALRPVQDSNTVQTNGTTWEESSSNQTSDSQKYFSYTVKEGDTLKIISKEFYGDESKYPVLKEANNITDENMIITGEVIKVPILQ